MEEWWQHRFSLIALENKSNFQGCKTNWPPETQSTYALVYVISSCGGWLSDTDCSLCWLLVNELVVSVPTDTLLIKVREKLFFFNRPLIRCGWVRRVWVTTQMTRVNLVPRGREAALKSKHITWNWGNRSQVSTTNFFSVPVFSPTELILLYWQNLWCRQGSFKKSVCHEAVAIENVTKLTKNDFR